MVVDIFIVCSFPFGNETRNQVIISMWLRARTFDTWEFRSQPILCVGIVRSIEACSAPLQNRASDCMDKLVLHVCSCACACGTMCLWDHECRLSETQRTRCTDVSFRKSANVLLSTAPALIKGTLAPDLTGAVVCSLRISKTTWFWNA